MSENSKDRAGTPADLAGVLFNAYHLRLLELFLLRPAGSLHVREIARRTGIPVGSLLRELRQLSGAGLLRRSRVGNQVHYEVDSSCSLVKELTAMMRKLERPSRADLQVAETGAAYVPSPTSRGEIARVLKRLRVSPRTLAAVCRRHAVASLSFFGSATRTDFRPGSDVDVLVEFEPQHRATLTHVVELSEALSKVFGGRRVDVATTAILKNPFRRAAIQRDLRVAYAAR